MNFESLFVPGRLCLFGEHSDWAGACLSENPSHPGYCLVTGTDQGIHARISRLTDYIQLQSVLPNSESSPLFRIPMTTDDLLAEARAGGFVSYVAGVAYEVLRSYPVHGLNIDAWKMDLPLKKGLSSSAAVSVLTARAFNRIYDLNLSLDDEMDLAYRGEILTGSACGRMDQICAYGQVPTFLKFDGDVIEISRLKPGATFHFLVVDLNARKDTRRILKDLNVGFRCADTTGRKIRYGLGEGNREILFRARNYIEQGKVILLGRLMTDAQTQFDEYVAGCCPVELTAPVLHSLLDDPEVRSMSLGGKGVGSQGDGTAQFLCESNDARTMLTTYIQSRYGMTGFDVTIRPA